MSEIVILYFITSLDIIIFIGIDKVVVHLVLSCVHMHIISTLDFTEN